MRDAVETLLILSSTQTLSIIREFFLLRSCQIISLLLSRFTQYNVFFMSLPKVGCVQKFHLQLLLFLYRCKDYYHLTQRYYLSFLLIKSIFLLEDLRPLKQKMVCTVNLCNLENSFLINLKLES